MTETNFAKGITAHNLRAFLELWPTVLNGIEEVIEIMNIDGDRLFGSGNDQFSWCHLYELPVRSLINKLFFELTYIVPKSILSGWYEQMAKCPGNIGELPRLYIDVNVHFNSRPAPSMEQIDAIRPHLPEIGALLIAIKYSFYGILYYGCYLNELIERARAGDDEALFSAVRVDPTVVGCPSVIDRISKARRLQDKEFLDELRKTGSGVTDKRKQINFEKMRLIFEILYETGALRLTNKQLYQLFVEELKLYTANSKGGGVEKSLRDHADTFLKMKKKATS